MGRVRSALESIDGVTGVNSNGLWRTVTVTYDAHKTDIAEMEKALEATGLSIEGRPLE